MSEEDFEGVQEFVSAIRAFVEFLECREISQCPLTFLDSLNAHMLSVATHGLRFEDIEHSWDTYEDFDGDSFCATLKEESVVCKRIEGILAPRIEIAKKNNADYEPHLTVVHLLCNDIAEAYHDLASGLRMWDVGLEGHAEGLWHWRFLKWHWHEHLYRALFGICLVKFEGTEDSLEYM